MLTEIEKIGYVVRPSDVRLTLTGKIVKQDNRLTLLLDDVQPSPLSFALMPYHEKKRNADPQQDALALELEKQIGKTVEVEGYWRDVPRGGSMQTLLYTVVRE